MIRGAVLVLGAALLVACGDKSPGATGTCGDGVVDTGEVCDDGVQNGSTGCTTSCTYACSDPVDCGMAPACQVAMCTADHACIFVADSTQDNASCGTGEHCNAGSCVSNGTCGNGVVEGTEACDFGTNNGTGTGCEANCSLSCASAAACDDNNPCNGTEVCTNVTDSATGNTGKKCGAGTFASDGVTCGTGTLCIGGDCVAASCGDSYTTPPNEECDDANPTPGDGCETNCKYTCVSTDVTRNCTPSDPCKGQGTCNDTTHTCTPGTPLANNTACGTGGYCKNSVCTQPVCRNGIKEPGEICDDGNNIDGDGCDNDCTYSCATASTDCTTTPPACEKWQCSATHTCQAVADSTKDTMSCGTNGETCQSGACTGGVCGNAITESGEQCDFGSASNGPGTGCETTCQYSCTISPNSCTDNNPCNGTETCGANTVGGHSGQKCSTGTPLADNTSCGTGKICKAQACVASVCGDGYVDASAGEYCEPPNSTTCDSKCRPKVCGDGILADNEQCDDNNLTNLDGCSKTCKFEQCQRINDLAMQFNPDPAGGYCTADALGKAIGSQAQSLMTNAINAGVVDGSITIFFELLGLDDLSGTSDASISLGLTGGLPVVPSGTFDKGRWTSAAGNADLDWWYSVTTSDLDASRQPTSLIPGSITAKTLNTTPSNMTFTVNFVGVNVTMIMYRTKMTAQTGAVTKPTVSTGTTPGHLAAEHLDPTLTSFEAMGSHDTNGIATGKLCGATTAGSLYNTFVPAAITQYCPSYDISHTMLDLYIGGCTYAIFFPIIKATQPDSSRSGTDTYKFQFDTSTHTVTSCTKNNGATQAKGTAGFTDCLTNAGYTSYYKFTADRVIGK